jgi:hypothetical protein
LEREVHLPEKLRLPPALVERLLVAAVEGERLTEAHVGSHDELTVPAGKLGQPVRRVRM